MPDSCWNCVWALQKRSCLDPLGPHKMTNLASEVSKPWTSQTRLNANSCPPPPTRPPKTAIVASRYRWPHQNQPWKIDSKRLVYVDHIPVPQWMESEDESGTEPQKMNIDLFNSVIVLDWHRRWGDTAKLYYDLYTSEAIYGWRDMQLLLLAPIEKW